MLRWGHTVIQSPGPHRASWPSPLWALCPRRCVGAALGRRVGAAVAVQQEPRGAFRAAGTWTLAQTGSGGISRGGLGSQPWLQAPRAENLCTKWFI